MDIFHVLFSFVVPPWHMCLDDNSFNRIVSSTPNIRPRIHLVVVTVELGGDIGLILSSRFIA